MSSKKMLIMLLMALMLLTLTASAAGAQGEITVTAADPNIADDGACSLIEAIVNANDDAQTHADCAAGSGADTITLAADAVYTLSQVDNSAMGDNGLPIIASALTITATNATIERSAEAGTPPFRVFLITDTGSLTLNGVTVRGGQATEGDDSWGGGIANWGTLMLNHSAVVSNTAHWAGGIFSGDVLTLTYSTVAYNVAERQAGGIHHQIGQAYLSYSSISYNRVISGISGGGITSKGYTNTDTLMTISHCEISTNTVGGVDGDGGGISNDVAEMLIEYSSISGNSVTSDGGGIRNVNGVMNIEACTISNNVASGSTKASGGGAVNFAVGSDASITLKDSVVAGNLVDGGVGGGGLSNFAEVDMRAVMTLDNCAVQDNHATGLTAMLGFGGGIYNGVTTLATNAVSELTLRDTTISGNTAVVGGGIGNGSMNPHSGTTQVVILNGSTVSGNTAQVSTGGSAVQTGNGGGIFNINGAVHAVNSTVSGNIAQGDPTQQGGMGGGIANAAAGMATTTVFTNTTVASNVAFAGGGLANAYLPEMAGAGPANMLFKNTLVAGNTALAGAMYGNGCLNNPGVGDATLTSQGYNLEDGPSCSFTQPTDLPNAADVQLGALADNGGDTATHALLAGSPAIDAGDNAACPATDQRGITRPQGAACDIGAYEYAQAQVPALGAWGIGAIIAVLAGALAWMTRRR